MQGFADVASRYFTKLFKAGIKRRKWYIFDASLYVLQPFVTLLLGVSALLALIQSRSPHGLHIYILSDGIGNIGFKLFMLVQFIVTPLVLLKDKKISKKFFAMLVLFSSNIFFMPTILQVTKNMVQVSDVQWQFIANGINISYYLVFIILTGLLLGKKALVFFIRYILYGVYTVTWIPITIQGILRKNNKDWNPTKHVRNVEICDVK